MTELKTNFNEEIGVLRKSCKKTGASIEVIQDDECGQLDVHNLEYKLDKHVALLFIVIILKMKLSVFVKPLNPYKKVKEVKMSFIEVQINPVKPEDFEQWKSLYIQYLAFYKTTLTEPELEKVWSWFFNSQEKIYCHVAMHQNQLIGLVHFREYLRPIRANAGVFIDDLFVKREYRGQQVARALIQNVNDFCKNHDIALIRWITAQDNVEAIRLYDKVAATTSWKMYEKIVS